MTVLRDLLSELSLAEKLTLLGKIYWHKLTDSRLVRFARIFCGGVYTWLFCGKTLNEVETSYPFTDKDLQMSNAGYYQPPIQDYLKGKTNVMPKYVPGLYTLDSFDGNDQRLSPADYGMNGTTLNDSKNFPEERPAWDAKVMVLFGSYIPQDICNQQELDYWFEQDYKPNAVIRMLKERQRSKFYRENGRISATYYIPAGYDASSYFIDLPPDKFRDYIENHTWSEDAKQSSS